VYEVHEINHIGELAEHRQLWRSLLQRTDSATFFQSLEWLEVYWRHFGRGRRLRVLIVSSADGVVGILPLVVRKEWRRFVPVRVLTYPLDDWGAFYGPIGYRPGETLTAGLDYIARSKRDWHLVDLRWVRGEGAEAELTERAMREAGFQSHASIRDKATVVDLDGTWEDFLAAHTSKWRNNYRRWQRNLGRTGEVGYQRYRPGEDADPRWDLYDICVEIARKSWQGSSSTGTTLSHPEVCEYLRDTHLAAARIGAIDMNIVRLDGETIGFAYNYEYRGYVCGLRIGYDPSALRSGLGNLMYGYAIEDSFKRGDHTYDMGPGYLAAKRYFYTHCTDILQFAHYHPTVLRGQLLRAKHYLNRWRQERQGPLHPATAS